MSIPLFALILCASVGAIQGDPRPATPTPKSERVGDSERKTTNRPDFEQMLGSLSRAPDMNGNVSPASTPKVLDAQDNTLIAYYEFKATGYREALDVLRWQFASSIVILIVVLAMVGMGLYFSWLQFRLGVRELQRREKGHAPTDDFTSAANPVTVLHTLKASKEGIEIHSVFGIILLVVSLLFFYLYLIHIYPVASIA